MNIHIIGIKQLYRQLKQVSDAALQGKSFLVVKNSKPIFRIEPLEQKGQKKYSLEDFKKLQFETRGKNLSKEVDKIVYGI